MWLFVSPTESTRTAWLVMSTGSDNPPTSLYAITSISNYVAANFDYTYNATILVHTAIYNHVDVNSKHAYGDHHCQ